MRGLKKFAKPFLRSVLKLKASGVISRLCESDGVAKSLGEALRETLQNEVTPDERMWVKRIEMHRDVLNASNTKITIVDYGAGKPGQELSEDEMRKGREVTRTMSEISKSASKPYFWSLLLFKLIRKFQPRLCLELGTSLGISAAYQAAALKLNGSGKIITLEGSDNLATLAKGHLKSLSLDNVNIVTGRFQDTLDGILKTNHPINFAFIDGHHDEQATIDYYKKIRPFLSDRAVLVFDDISWSDGMQRAWKHILSDKDIKISVDMWQTGICVLDSHLKSKKNIVIPLV